MQGLHSWGHCHPGLPPEAGSDGSCLVQRFISTETPRVYRLRAPTPAGGVARTAAENDADYTVVFGTERHLVGPRWLTNFPDRCDWLAQV